ncbi:MAG: sulfite exporter TauE/SafE family protein [Candidatus Amesbacteria bacterium]|nr:sulfite exporter TauE/SafE family protein [Candidatus Amesbacteria bacterium]
MQSCKVHIKGMHCRSCEIILEEEILKVPNVIKASVHHQKGIAVIDYQNNLDSKAVIKAIEDAGYTEGIDQHGWISKNIRDYRELGIVFLFVMGTFLLAKGVGVFGLTDSISGSYNSLPVVFLIGLTAGVSTCMALVGGLVLGAAARFSAENPGASRLEKFKPHLLFNLGRIISYFIFGGIIGWAGSFFQLSTSILGILTIVVGFVMLILGGQLIDIFPVLKKISFTLPKSISQYFGIKEQTNPVILGASTFFLPCGFTQAMQLYAMSTGSPITGALTLGVFALGTAPGLLGVGGLTSVVKGSVARYFFKGAGVVVAMLAIFNISNGLNLLGINFLETPKVLGKQTIVDGVQEIYMIQDSDGYSPNNFTITQGIPVRWIITSKNINTCASSIISSKLNIRQGLRKGENIIEFTPTEAGTIRFSCTMGMYNGLFNVISRGYNK